MSKSSHINLRKVALISASLIAVNLATACAPLQGHSAGLSETARQTVNHKTPLPAHQRYGLSHNLDQYNINPRHHAAPAPVQKLAEAKDVRLSPYVAPTQSTRRFTPPNLSAAPFEASRFEAPALRPRFQHHLGGPLGAFNSTPATASPQTSSSLAPAPKVSVPAINAPQVNAPNLSAPIVKTPILNTPTTNGPKLNNPVISHSEFNNALNAGQFGGAPFETSKLQSRDLSIPELPEAQKQVIRQEQAALAGIENKSIVAGSASLRSSLDAAFGRSQRLAAESLRVDEAEEVLKQTKARRRPRVEFRGTAGPRQSSTTFAFSDTTTTGGAIRRSAELDLTLPIYQGGRLRAERSSAEVGIETARATVSETRGQIIEQTAIAYLDVVRDRRLAQLYQNNVDLLREQQSSVAQLLALNESTLSEKALVDARLATQRIRLETGLGTQRESEARYRNLTGKAAPKHLPVPSFNLPLSLTEIQALAQQNSPELTSLINQAKSAEFDVDIAKSGNRPTLGLQGILRGAEGQSETIDRNTAAELLLNLRVPLSSGGEGKSRVRQAKIVRNRLNLEIRDAQDNLRDEIDQLWARKAASEKSQGFNRTQIEATQLAVNVVAEQRAEGVATILDLLNVQQTLLDAEIQAVEAKSRQDTASVQLLNLMGVYQ